MSSDTPGPDLTDLGYTYLAPPDAEMEFDDIETPSDAEGIEALYELIGRNARHMLASSPYFQGNSRGYSFYLVPPDAPPAPGGEGVWVAVSGNDLPGIIRVRLAKSRAAMGRHRPRGRRGARRQGRDVPRARTGVHDTEEPRTP